MTGASKVFLERPPHCVLRVGADGSVHVAIEGYHGAEVHVDAHPDGGRRAELAIALAGVTLTAWALANQVKP